MFSSLGTKLAMKKMGIPKDALNFGGGGAEPAPKKNAKGGAAVDDLDDDPTPAWAKWMTVRNLPLTAQAWLSPVPPPVPVAPECPPVGAPAPLDRDGKLVLGGGRKVLVVFLRCVGCACKCLDASPICLHALSQRKMHITDDLHALQPKQSPKRPSWPSASSRRRTR